ncbi:hypothetical protein HZ326_7947 [Fusarium oxysporum f. sp. albedinis]|nr:hypothetical protein HZ326_7947 [Fusarium oxysporum f. sp. albedinis]
MLTVRSIMSTEHATPSTVSPSRVLKVARDKVNNTWVTPRNRDLAMQVLLPVPQIGDLQNMALCLYCNLILPPAGEPGLSPHRYPSRSSDTASILHILHSAILSL